MNTQRKELKIKPIVSLSSFVITEKCAKMRFSAKRGGKEHEAMLLFPG